MDQASKGKTSVIFTNTSDFVIPDRIWCDLQVDFIIENKEELLNQGFKVTELGSSPRFIGDNGISIVVSWKVKDDDNGEKN